MNCCLVSWTCLNTWCLYIKVTRVIFSTSVSPSLSCRVTVAVLWFVHSSVTRSLPVWRPGEWVGVARPTPVCTPVYPTTGCGWTPRWTLPTRLKFSYKRRHNQRTYFTELNRRYGTYQLHDCESLTYICINKTNWHVTICCYSLDVLPNFYMSTFWILMTAFDSIRVISENCFYLCLILFEFRSDLVKPPISVLCYYYSSRRATVWQILKATHRFKTNLGLLREQKYMEVSFKLDYHPSSHGDECRVFFFLPWTQSLDIITMVNTQACPVLVQYNQNRKHYCLFVNIKKWLNTEAVDCMNEIVEQGVSSDIY